MSDLTLTQVRWLENRLWLKFWSATKLGYNQAAGLCCINEEKFLQYPAELSKDQIVPLQGVLMTKSSQKPFGK